MKLNIPEGALKLNYPAFLRQAGYVFVTDFKQGGKESFMRSLTRQHYPRFHMYVEDNGGLIFNLHLDQKQASYEGSHMHNAEYDGDLVEAELQRLASMIGISMATSKNQVQKPMPAAYNPDSKKEIFTGKSSVLGHGSLDDFKNNHEVKKVKKSWWKIWP